MSDEKPKIIPSLSDTANTGEGKMLTAAKYEVRASYSELNFPAMDEIISRRVGRKSDYSGLGFGVRDMGWICGSEFEAHKIAAALKSLNVTAEVSPQHAEESND